jgi:uncharacterized protein YxeA
MLDIVIALIAIIAVIGAGIYFYMDMKDHKATNTNEFEHVNKNIEEEQKTRLGNIKYVVDQVNTTNEEMDTEYTARFEDLEKSATGFGKLIKTTNGTKDVADVADPQSIDLMKRVSVVGGMTIKDLQSGTKFSACGTGANASDCIEFPNQTGDTVLKGITGSSSSVVSASPFKAESGATVSGVLNVNNIKNISSANDLVISSGTNNTITLNKDEGSIIIKSGNNIVGVGTSSIDITVPATTTSASGVTTTTYPIKINNVSLKGISLSTDPSVVTDGAFITALRDKNILHF